MEKKRGRPQKVENEKKLVSFRLSDDVMSMLKQMAKKDDRSATNMLEVIVKEAAEKKGIITTQ